MVKSNIAYRTCMQFLVPMSSRPCPITPSPRDLLPLASTGNPTHRHIRVLKINLLNMFLKPPSALLAMVVFLPSSCVSQAFKITFICQEVRMWRSEDNLQKVTNPLPPGAFPPAPLAS